MNKRQKYSKEFKHDAVRLLTEQGYSIAEAARNLGINYKIVSIALNIFLVILGISLLGSAVMFVFYVVWNYWWIFTIIGAILIAMKNKGSP